MKMEALDPTAAAACFMVDAEDDLLNFSLEEEQTLLEQETLNSRDPSSSSSSFSSNPVVTSLLPHLPAECVEEELEWLSNKDAFPAVEFGILSDNPGIVFDHHSPVSVLENSSSTSNSSGNANANGSTYTSCCASLKVPVNYPVRARSKRRRRKRRSGLTDVPIDHCLSLNQSSFKNTKRQQPLLSLPMNSAKSASIGRRCQHCGVDKTPQWRAGPLGPKTLCNACGVRYKSGRLLPEYRPANSPTFSAALHSNSHRKVLEMRKQKTGVGGMIIHEACGYRPPWLIADDESFDVPIKHCLSVNQGCFKNNTQQQPLLPVQMNSAKSASVGMRYQDCGVDMTQKWQAGPLGPSMLNACGMLYKSVNQASVKNNQHQQPLLSLQMSSALISSTGRRCQDCGANKTPKWLSGPLGPKTLCNACGELRYKLVNLVSCKNNKQQQPSLSLPMNSAKSANIERRCRDCGVDKTPKWRAGPLGLKTLCNDCGMRYKSGRLLPKYYPATRPTTPLLIVEAEASSEVPMEHCLSVNQAGCKKDKQHQPLVSLPMNSAKSASNGRRCQHCGVDNTPQWRAGPLEQKTLCNACGMRYRSCRLLPEYRPVNSPTFSAALHSNSHRKVLEMRKQKLRTERNDDS